MPRTLPNGLLPELQKRFGPQRRVNLFEIVRGDGSQFFWADQECVVTSILTGAAQQFKPWVEQVGEIRSFMSLRADYGEFMMQNLSGNTIDREVAALLESAEFNGAFCIWRRHFLAIDLTAFEFHGFLKLMAGDKTRITFRMNQLLQPNNLTVYEGRFTRACRWRFTSAQCGYRRGSIFVPLTTADVFSASTIDKSGGGGLGLIADYLKFEVAMILEGTGAGQERTISSHTADVFTISPNWTTNPDGTSKFIVTGPGTILVSATLADIHTSTTIGKTGAGWTADAWKDQHVVILSGTGAGQRRRITTNSSTTNTVSPAWTTVPDATSRFIVVYGSCPKTRAACVDRGVIERFSGIIHLQAQLTQISTPANTTGGIGDSGGGDRGEPRHL